MRSDRANRRSYEDSCRYLHQIGWLGTDKIPPPPLRQPRYDDEEPHPISFFRTRVEGDFSNLTLIRTFFGRSEVASASFRNTDLSESTLCWNDFIGVDFSDATLTGSDLRASLFNGVDFSRCDLRDCDLRLSTFDDCDFSDADLRGAKFTRSQRKIDLSNDQVESIDWQDNPGEEPGGG